MKTLTLKIPETLNTHLASLAAHKGITKSALVREALQELSRSQPPPDRCSALAQVEDLVGCVEGPEDLSSNPEHLADLGH